MTRQRLPRVAGDWLTLVHPHDGTQTRLRVGSAEWHSWLGGEASTSFSYDAEGLTLTVRRERQRHGWYWYAYRKHEGRLRKAYLGRGEDLSATTLHLAAQSLGRQSGAAAVAPLQLRLLGTPWFGRSDQPVAQPTAKVAALLAYLAVTGTPQARDGMLALLWPESATAAARKNLRNALWAIRTGLGTDVLSEGTHLALGAGVWSDVQDFERHLAAGDHQRGLPLYRGPLLDGLVLDDVEDFELWLTTQRARLEQTYLRAAGARVALLGTQGDWQQALTVANAALAHDPLQEPLWRAIMEGHARLGQRAEALRAYEALCTTLDRELGLAPLPATDALREAIARGDLTPVAPTPAAAATDCPRENRVHPRVLRGPFLGREREIASLDAILDMARPGQARVVLLSGDAGIGKSRLWQEWSMGLGDDVRVMETRCLEVTQPLPYAPLLSFFDRADVLQRMPHQSPGTPAWLAEIWRLNPATTQQRSTQAAEEAHAAGDERHRVLEAFVQCFMALSSQPLVVCLDDAHWADSATLDCIGYLMHRLHDRPLVLVLAFRPAEAPAAFVRLCSTWCQQGLLQQLQVSQLEIDEVGALVEALGGERTRVEALYAQGGGNPLLIAELLRAAPGDMPPLLAGLIAARLDRLPAEARRLLQAAAIVEPDGDFATLCRTAGSDEDATLDALDLLLQAGILVEREQVYRFAIPLFAEEVRRGLSGARRASLHRRAAAAITDRYDGRATLVAGRLARHYAEAGEQSRAAQYAQLAAEHALTLAAWDEAAALYRQALALEPSATRQLGLGNALLHAGDAAAACAAFSTAHDLWKDLGDRDGAGGAALALAEFHAAAGSSALVQHWAEVALSYLEDQADPAQRALAHILKGMARLLGGQELAQAEADLTMAARLATAGRLDELAARANFLLGNTRAERGDIAGALVAYRETIDESRRSGHELLEALGHNNLAYHAVLAGDLATAHTHLEAGLALATKRQLRPVLPFLYSTCGAVALAEARWQEAEQWTRRAMAEAERYGNAPHQANLRAQLGRAAQGRGDRDTAVIEMEGARVAAAGLDAPHLRSQIDLWLATLYLERGERKAAAMALLRAEDRLARGERAGLSAWAAAIREQITARVA